MEITSVSFRGSNNDNQIYGQTRGYQKLNHHLTNQKTREAAHDTFLKSNSNESIAPQNKEKTDKTAATKPQKKKRSLLGKITRVITAPVRLVYHNPLPALAVGGTLMGGYYLAVPALYKAFNEQKAINATNNQLRQMKAATKTQSFSKTPQSQPQAKSLEAVTPKTKKIESATTGTSSENQRLKAQV